MQLAMPASEGTRLRTLTQLFHRRWAVPILAELSRRDGAKFVTLVHSTGAAAGSVRATLDSLIELEWVTPNPGYGHPLRPEYLLTPNGAKLAPTCVRLDDALGALGLHEVALRKWSMPVLDSVSRAPRRFGELAARLVPITDRALSLSLADLSAAALVARRPCSAARTYAPTAAGGRLADLIAGL